MNQTFLIFWSTVLVNNFVLSRFLGICPFLGVSKSVKTAFSMGMAVTFVIAIASAVTHPIYYNLLVPSTDSFLYRLVLERFDTVYDLGFLYTIAFILIIAALVQFIEMFIKKTSPSLYRALGVYLPLITTNCAVLGITVINKDAGYSLGTSVINGVAAALGFTLAIVLMAGIRERMEKNDILPHFKGMPIALITAGIMSLAFLGFSNLL